MMFPTSLGATSRFVARALPPVFPLNAVGDFGNKFRKAREAKGISLDDVSNVTKISSRMLQAIEEEHFDLLPGGVFNRGFIRAYAKHLGLNDEEAVTDYLACLRQAQIDAQTVREPVRAPEPRPVVPKREPPAYSKPTLTAHPPVQVEEELPDLHLPRAEDVRRPRRDYASRDIGFSWRFIAPIAVVAVLGTFLYLRHSRTAHSEVSASESSAAATTSQPAADVAAPPAPNKSDSSPAPAASAPASSPTPAQSQSSPFTPPSAKAATSPTPSSPTASPASTQEPVDATPLQQAPVKMPHAKPAAAPPQFTLVIRASETSWVSVTADGELVAQETLIAPAATSVRAARQISVRVGNAAGVTFIWNGEEVPAQGGESEVKTFTFDASGMTVVSPPQPAPSQP